MSIFNDRYLYVFNSKASKDYISLISATSAGGQRLRKDDEPEDIRYRVYVEGENAGVRRVYFDALTRARQLLRTQPVGKTVVLARVRPDDSVTGKVKFRHVLRKPPVADTPGPLGIDRVIGYIESTFKKARFAGQCVCKPNSDHARCSAVDYFDTHDNMVKMKNALLANAKFFDIKYVILFDRIYFADGHSEHYDGVFHSHIHVSVNQVGQSAC